MTCVAKRDLFWDGWRLKVDGWRLKVDGWRLKVDGWRLKVDGWRLKVALVTSNLESPGSDADQLSLQIHRSRSECKDS